MTFHSIRVSSQSYIPDLETHETFDYPVQASGGADSIALEGSNALPVTQPAPLPAPTVINIEPHPQVVAKKKEVLHDLAVQKHAVQEAKGSFGVI